MQCNFPQIIGGEHVRTRLYPYRTQRLSLLNPSLCRRPSTQVIIGHPNIRTFTSHLSGDGRRRKARRRKAARLDIGTESCGSLHGTYVRVGGRGQGGSACDANNEATEKIAAQPHMDFVRDAVGESAQQNRQNDIDVRLPSRTGSRIACRSQDSLSSLGKVWECGIGSSTEDEGWSSEDTLGHDETSIRPAAVLTRGDFFGVSADPIPSPDRQVCPCCSWTRTVDGLIGRSSNAYSFYVDSYHVSKRNASYVRLSWLICSGMPEGEKMVACISHLSTIGLYGGVHRAPTTACTGCGTQRREH